MPSSLSQVSGYTALSGVFGYIIQSDVWLYKKVRCLSSSLSQVSCCIALSGVFGYIMQSGVWLYKIVRCLSSSLSWWHPSVRYLATSMSEISNEYITERGTRLHHPVSYLCSVMLLTTSFLTISFWLHTRPGVPGYRLGHIRVSCYHSSCVWLHQSPEWLAKSLSQVSGSVR